VPAPALDLARSAGVLVLCCNGIHRHVEIPMPTYRYRCVDCGGFDLLRPMSEATEPTLCPGCREPARRLFGIRTAGSVEPGVRAAMDASARSADSPQVVNSVPGRSRRATRITTDPRHARLPRP